MNFQMKKLGLCVMLASFAGVVLPAEAATKLENIKVDNSMAAQTRIEFQFDGPVGGYQDRLQYDPEQLVLNLSDAESALLKNDFHVKSKAVRNVNVKQSGGDLSVAVDLESLVPYEVSQQGNSLYVTLGQDPRAVAAKQGYSDQSVVGKSKKTVAGGINRINGINFKKGASGEGLVVVNLDNKNAALELVPKGTHLIAKFHGSAVDPNLLAVMDVNDYGTLLRNIDVSEAADGAVLDIALQSAEFDAKHVQNGESIVITVAKKKPVVKVTDAPRYSGKNLSLSFQDIPVRNALKILAEEVKVNLVMNDSVSGNITVNFDNVPWDQALDTILRVKGLDKRMDGNILLIGQQEELAAYEQKQLEEQEKKSAKEPLVTEFLQINYAKAADIVKLLKTNDGANSISAEQGGSSNYGQGGGNGAEASDSLLSVRGTATVDERTNTLIIKDTEASIANVKRLIEKLDTPIQQVMVEARIVAVDETVADQMGIHWNLGSDNIIQSGHEDGKWSGTAGTNTIPAEAEYKGGVINIGRLGSNFNLNLTLAALETENRTETIASPRVTTTNQKKAMIEQGYQIPSVTAASSGATTVEWTDAVLKLEVTPQITPDDSIFLDLEITNDDLGQTVTTTTGSSVSINKRAVQTSVLVGNGETLVLGGIFQQEIKRIKSQIPFLGDIPVVGWLFKTVENSNQRREVMVFITPHIVEGAVGR
ncbi:type IV pilus secretin PilQ [Succinimonas amylolytica]|uniref:type IV pilus secretin PilQ n=1 Tax=Succinimonas amylolytica TaxID=83769 RepID=UPI000363F79D|nr:type IV pilus secretin PilQ [Succinimonas amylolytica]